MSLVDYSSDEDETDVQEDEEEEEEEEKNLSLPQQSSQDASAVPLSSSFSSAATFVITENVRLQPGPCTSRTDSGGSSLKLPDASQLLASFGTAKERLTVHTGGDAVVTGKRSDINGSADGPLKKIPKGNLMPSRIFPDTAGGLLLPPQLKGRSNVATEDLDKLFTKRRKPT